MKIPLRCNPLGENHLGVWASEELNLGPHAYQARSRRRQVGIFRITTPFHGMPLPTSEGRFPAFSGGAAYKRRTQLGGRPASTWGAVSGRWCKRCLSWRKALLVSPSSAS
jgi:hypothetical protein